MEDQGDPGERDRGLSVVLPSGLERTVTVHGSKPVIDLLVTLCAKYHLNPSDHTVEILSHRKNQVCFKPNSLIGSLEADTIVLKPKVAEDKARRPYTPEATVRLLVNYRKSHKTVVRVSPRVPLEDLVSTIGQKCEFPPASTALLRDAQTQEPLDLSKSLNDLGIRELFAKDTAAAAAAEASIEVLHATETPKTDPPTGCGEGQQPSRNEKKRGANIGFLSLFRRKKDKDGRVYMPVSQDLQEAPSVRASTLGRCSADASTPCTTKKRPAPRPPVIMASQSAPDNISGHRVTEPQSSADTTLRRTKRRAPLPPCANSHASLPAAAEGSAGTSSSVRTWELRTRDDSADSSRTASPLPSSPSSSSSSSSSTLSSSATQLLPPPPPQEEEGYACAPAPAPQPQRAAKDLSRLHPALAQIITSSLSNGTLRNRRGDAPFSKSHGDEDDEGDSVTHEPLLGPKCLVGGRGGGGGGGGGGGDPHPEQWGDAVQRKGMTTFKVVPAKKHRLYPVDPGPVVPGDRIPTPRRDAEEVGESGIDGGSPEPRTAPPADRYGVRGPAPDGGAPSLPAPDPEGIQGELGVSQAEPAGPPPQDSHGSQAQSSGVDRPSPEPETGAIQGGEEEEEEEEEEEVREAVHEEAGKDAGVLKEEIQGEGGGGDGDGDYDEVPDGDDERFPPPPPPVSYDDRDGVPDERSALLQSPPALSPPPPPPSSSATQTPAKDGPSPLKRVSEAPSRFAQAVALAVQRTRAAQAQGRGYGSLFRSRPGAAPVPTWLPQSSVNSGSCLG